MTCTVYSDGFKDESNSFVESFTEMRRVDSACCHPPSPGLVRGTLGDVGP